MKKRNMLPLALALAMLPAAGSAQDLPELFTGVYQSIGEGLETGAALAMQHMDEELTLSIETDAPRVEEGKSVTLSVAAGNPLPKPVGVTITLDAPDRLRIAGETTFTALLPAAQYDEETGALVPSETVFEREATLTPGGGSEQAALRCEMSMGTRFYRAQAPLALCVPDVRVSASVEGAQAGRLQPGDAFAYRIEVANAGDAPKDVALEMTLPTAMIAGELPQGFALDGQLLRGQVHAAAGTGDAPAAVLLPMRMAEDALKNDEDARRLISAALRADGERVALSRLELCDAKISAKLTCDTDRLAIGEQALLSVTVVNSGLAEADVDVTCMLPQGLSLAQEALEADDEAEDEDEPAEEVALPLGDGANGSGLAVPADIVQLPAQAASAGQADRALRFDVHMRAASEQGGDVIASTQVIEIPVVAVEPQDKLSDRLLGASLLWSVNDEDAQLGDAVAMRVYRAGFMGMSRADLNGLFWAGVLLLATVVCLCAAVKRDDKEPDFCCD